MVRYYWNEQKAYINGMADLELSWLECSSYDGYSVVGIQEFHVPSDYPSGTTQFRVYYGDEVRASEDYTLQPGQTEIKTYTGSAQTYYDDYAHTHYYKSTTGDESSYTWYGLGDPWNIGYDYKYKGQSGWAQFVRDHFVIYVYSGNVTWHFEDENDDNNIHVWMEADGPYEVYIGFDLWQNYGRYFAGIRYVDVDVKFMWEVYSYSNLWWYYVGPIQDAYYYYAGLMLWYDNALVKETSGADTNIIVPTVACWNLI